MQAEPAVPIGTPEHVLLFWQTAGPDRWFEKDDAFDAAVRDRFLATYEAAAAGHLADWEATPDGALALIIVLDQFPRNMFRGSARTYAADPLACAAAERALARGYDQMTDPSLRTFFYLPFMHSESRLIHVVAERLYRGNALPDNLDFALRHKAIIDRFGRYPHRNATLGRASTPEEELFLQQPGSRF